MGAFINISSLGASKVLSRIKTIPSFSIPSIIKVLSRICNVKIPLLVLGLHVMAAFDESGAALTEKQPAAFPLSFLVCQESFCS